ncbi:fumarylacetoacetate hydrolase family protein [Nocardiopsis mangrovi]|uniref:Fumarylacetoacetate hydrolase family protein n=2 Tax=Nocardiopsis mangrovi TaxID=1179818 RepID=A0ABV9DR49_9ACTN
MKLLHVGPAGHERPAVRTDDGTLLDLGGVLPSVPVTPEGIGLARAALDQGRLPELPEAPGGTRIGAPIPRPGKIVCIGLNYRRHAAETGAAVPEEPIVFMKAASTVVGPDDPVLVPRGSTKTDYEVELGVVIGATARYTESPEDALSKVAGYVVCHDVSERAFQLERGGQWDKGKNCETFNPMGPWLVTADSVPDPDDLGIRLWVNGEKRQDSTTADMIFGVAELVHYLSRFMVLEPGDVINTGTPEGVALGMPDPKPYLRPGDTVECEIDGLGRQRQQIGAA